jgi:site-specific DNA-methyltransferase (adenine-specific)
MNIDLRLGDCLEVLKTIPDNSIDSVVTDPPYGLSFMGKKWDYDVPSVEIWTECLRVLKPGGHLLSFAGSRTYHRMAVRIEDAGFEIRDQLMWVFGSGFPKSHNIGKAIQKQSGDVKVIGTKQGAGTTGKSYISNNEDYVDGEKGVFKKEYDEIEINNEWEGWGTALKPAHEPIVMARKPLSEKSIAENVLKHGTGGINIDGSRIEMKDKENINFDRPRVRKDQKEYFGNHLPDGYFKNEDFKEYNEAGRFPANIIFDEEAGQLLDEQSGVSKSGKNKLEKGTGGIWKKGTNLPIGPEYGDKGGASRFFYCPKAAKSDRNEGLDGIIEIFTPTIKLVYLLKNNIWEKEGLKTIPADTDKSHQKVIDESIIMEDNKWNIESFGNYIMEQLLKDNKSITETEINSTTIYQTLNSWIQNHTRTYIAELFGEMVSDIKFVSDVEQKSTTLNITLQNKDGYSQSVKNVELKGLWSINIVPSKSSHPTVKPTDLMRYLINLVTPPNGTILDPFMGSGSTGKAAVRCGLNFIGIEKEQEYMDIASARIEHEKNKPIQTKLFDGQ